MRVPPASVVAAVVYAARAVWKEVIEIMCASAASAESRYSLPKVLVVLTCVLAVLPCVVFRYLPMTDLPQHEAIISIMRHLHDPAYGFERYYEWALDRTLYVFPYFLAVGLAFLVPVKLAVHITVLLAVLSFPVGVILYLRALKRPLSLALLAVPLMYNRAFFWGFIHFGLGVGLAFIVIALLVGSWSRRTGWWVAGLCVLTALTHIYGLLVVFAYACGWLVSGRRIELLRRLIWTAPAVLALVGWGVFAAGAPGYGVTEWAPFDLRLKELSHSILGGYADDSEDLILYAWAALVVLLASSSFPVSWARLKSLSVQSRAAYLFIVANVVAYFVLPVATPTAKFIHFRHAVLAAMMAPLIVERLPKNVFTRVVLCLVPGVAMAAISNTWLHFWQFQREASGFDAVLDAIPPRSNIVQLTYDSKGQVLRSHAYLHFGAYAQAAKGGVFAVSFPILFWNIPVKGRSGSGMPATPKNMEWSPARFNERRMGRFYDTVLVRNKNGVVRQHAYGERPLNLTVGNWQVFRAPAH